MLGHFGESRRNVWILLGFSEEVLDFLWGVDAFTGLWALIELPWGDVRARIVLACARL
jgi:hypothetical protein